MKHRTFLALLACAALSLFQKSFAQQAPDYRVRFRYETVSFPENLSGFQQNPSFSAEELADGRAVRFVQFYELPGAAARERMAKEGLRTLDYVSFGAWRAIIPTGFDLGKMTGWGIRSVVPVEARWKVSRNLTERPLGAWAIEGERVAVIAQVAGAFSQTEAARLFTEKSIEITKAGSQNGIFDLKIPISDIEKVASLPFVKWLEIQPRPSTPEDTRGRSLHRSGSINSDGATGLHFDGRGVGTMTRDDGAVGPHIDYQGRITNVSAGFDQFDSHGDGTAGILAGGGNLDPVQKGMASGSKIWVVDYASDFQDTTLGLCLAEKISVTNTSYSDGCNDGYNTHSQTVDQQLFQNPELMHCFSAGNQGSINCQFGAGAGWGNITGGHKQSKNSIATANLYEDLSLEGSSSRGPATDGRIKPDLAAHGQGQVSTDADNTYQVFGGTSAASPGTAGVFAQLVHAFKELNGGQEPQAALIKSLMLNTANDMGNPGPDFKYGWGHLNAWRAYNSLKDNQFLINSVDNGGASIHPITVPPGAKLAKFMLYWADPESDLSGAKALVNDLDLTGADAGGTAFAPYILNPFPDPDSLDQPATTGADHLNNVEQIAVKDPQAGTFFLTVNGFEVPQGPVRYILTYEFLMDEITLTYPMGGEGMVPGEKERIHWDALPGTDEFGIEFSADGGAAWEFLGNPSGSQKHFEWTVPDIVSGNCFFRISRNGVSGQNLLPFTVIGQPKNFGLAKTCPDFTTISWEKTPGAVAYDVFLLGQTRMDSIGTTADTFYQLPTQNLFDRKWVSVRSVGAAGPAGRRVIAVELPGGLYNCPQDRDLRLAKLVEPSGPELVFCGPAEQVVAVRIANDGLDPAENFPVTYVFGNDAPVTEAFPGALAAGDSAIFVFSKKLDLTVSEKKRLKVFTQQPLELVHYNDSTAIGLNIAIHAGIGMGVKQDFETPEFPPALWAVENPDEDKTWEKRDDITGITGAPTSAAYLNIFDYPDTSATDRLRTPPFDLTGLANPLLAFDLAYVRYTDLQYVDCLRIEALGDCGKAAPATIWHRCQDDLTTSAPQQAPFVPNDAGQWQQQLVDLSAFKDQKVVIRFTLENGYGNNIYLDNIGILNELVMAPEAEFTATADTICRGDSITYASQSTGSNIAHSWAFGSGALPATAITAGPHKVKYPTAGAKTIKLIVTNALGKSEETKSLFVRSLPVANFSSAIAQNLVTFTNTTTSGTTYLWDFGDGTTSTEASPVHQYLSTGSFNVSLTATNSCGTNLKVKTVSIQTISAGEPSAGGPGCRIVPNPNDGEFLLAFQNVPASEKLRVSIFDNSGREVRSSVVAINPSEMSYQMSELELPKGFYSVQIEGGGWRRMLKMAVQ